MKNDEFGNRMKDYEREFTSQKISIDNILCVRIDGKGFSKYTKSFEKPFDRKLSDSMILTTMDLVEETNAAVGYVQSDEITLIFVPGEKASEYIFGGKTAKINSVFASMATAFFNKHISLRVKYSKLAFFDCRTWSVPDVGEASNVLLWRAQDARKNSVSAFFRWTLGHKAMKNLNTTQMKEVLLENGYDWDSLNDYEKYGRLVKKSNHDFTDHLGYFGDLSWEDRIKFIKE